MRKSIKYLSNLVMTKERHMLRKPKLPLIFKMIYLQPGVVTQTCMWRLRKMDHKSDGLHSKTEAKKGCTARPCLKLNKAIYSTYTDVL